MKIIDAHLHLFRDSAHTREMARAVGHENTADHLRAYYTAHDIVCGVVMGNHDISLEGHCYPEPFRYCVGLDSACMPGHGGLEEAQALVEGHLRRPNCVGIKLYPGYNETWLSAATYQPFYALARSYGKPVAVHMGQTSFAGAKLKYSHPLTLDEVAADWPDVQFVMCHFGNPFLADAAAVLEKNPNVWADLSGLLVGIVDLEDYFRRQSAYVSMLRGWMAYVEDYGKFLFGTDFPAVNVGNYIDFIARLVPEEHHEAVFFHNANRVYRLGL